ncbi:WYL domain-containing protein [Rhizobium giardinii]|uniref:WYL domain-containing protein n=1 Tax=Rhizobium giardinii TaxID=56731 RepID=UPI003D6FAD8F
MKLVDAVVAAIYLLFRRGSPACDSRPDNPRFQTWDEAFNRPIGDDLRFLIKYVNRDGEITKRVIAPTSIHLMRGQPWLFIKAQCHLRNAERTFRSDRIQFARNLKTKRVINDLGAYLRSRY